jgi:hypothetical protein
MQSAIMYFWIEDKSSFHVQSHLCKRKGIIFTKSLEQFHEKIATHPISMLEKFLTIHWQRNKMVKKHPLMLKIPFSW